MHTVTRSKYNLFSVQRDFFLALHGIPLVMLGSFSGMATSTVLHFHIHQYHYYHYCYYHYYYTQDECSTHDILEYINRIHIHIYVSVISMESFRIKSFRLFREFLFYYYIRSNNWHLARHILDQITRMTACYYS